MKVLLIPFLFLTNQLFAQITTYYSLNSKDTVVTSYLKHVPSDSSIHYYSCNLSHRKVLRLDVIESKPDKGTIKISEIYSYYDLDTSRNAKNRDEFHQLVLNDTSTHYVIEQWDYFYIKGRIDRIELREHGRFSQVRRFNHSKKRCEINYHFVRDSVEKSFYAKDSILIHKRGKVLERYYLRFDDPIYTKSVFTKKSLSIYSDDKLWKEFTYHSNNWDMNDRLMSMMVGEGPLYTMFIEQFDKYILKSEENCSYSTLKEVALVKKNRKPYELTFYADGKFSSKLRIIR